MQSCCVILRYYWWCCVHIELFLNKQEVGCTKDTKKLQGGKELDIIVLYVSLVVVQGVVIVAIAFPFHFSLFSQFPTKKCM